MPPSLSTLRDVPPLFLAGVAINWVAMGVLAWEPRWMLAVVGLLVIGTAAIFFGAYTHRPSRR